ncbi:MAG TPA: class I SAM-dependent methyltransferase [Gaiellaceae bacterium]|nr:class I SAM-dependent methyltransferase [Gaiellaceae bacterium]
MLEVGPGTGQVTRRLLELGTTSLVALEPDPALAAHLRRSLGEAVEVRETTLEDARLATGSFDLAVAASSFHWVVEDRGLEQLFDALRARGWLAMWWTLFGVPGEPDEFVTATGPLLDALEASPSRGEAGRPRYALDTEVRLAALQTAGFRELRHDVVRWSARWDAKGIRALYRSFSPIARLREDRRDHLLDEIARIASEEFGNRVERTLLTSIYTARRPG